MTKDNSTGKKMNVESAMNLQGTIVTVATTSTEIMFEKGEQFAAEMASTLEVIIDGKDMTLAQAWRKWMHDRLDKWIDGGERMKDGSKDKEFYDLGKKMFDHMQTIKAKAEPKMMTEEDEAFDEIERKQNQKVQDSNIRLAQESALHFITDIDSTELGLMTLRKAYETGYRAGMYAEQRKKYDN